MMTAEQPTIPSAPFPLHALTTSELGKYRAELEHEIARHAPTAAVVDTLRSLLDDVLREQEERARIAHAR